MKQDCHIRITVDKSDAALCTNFPSVYRTQPKIPNPPAHLPAHNMRPCATLFHLEMRYSHRVKGVAFILVFVAPPFA